MSQPVAKPKKLWSNPKVFISPTHLIVEERYYALAQTRGAYEELVLQETETKAAQTPSPPDNRSGFRKTMDIVAGIIIILFVIVFVAWWNDGYDTYGSGKNSNIYQLILMSEFGPVVVLKHSNEKKLKEIASQVNQALIVRGVTPQTGFATSPQAAQ